ncbi:phosphoenolpyruvate--protein phosphotransferase [Paenibacillus sp. UMB4589-SE434]|uniref:phosphoenolpyruvate--protein phosphotransferase n=1 Tax=Paenibacillus sp. UMB4589-SE434 TaxID=3046314 RepID=UPI00254CD807|nr:phosphoenolpyruvate--protein phosphotransferase [Paenibacillus sp. UMB4589-SE434]MDK8182690.1 phosphoenolpyruvate--protein phosphotransferase [Paenibacillus sp. UMB4589-SE434]
MQLKGIAAASGYAIGPAFIMQEQTTVVERKQIPAADVDAEATRLQQAVNQAMAELEQIKEDTAAKLGEHHAEIFATHILVLQDEEFIGQAIVKVRSEAVNAEYALQEVTQQLVDIFTSMDNEYMRERASDFRDVSQRVLSVLTGKRSASLNDFHEAVVLFAHDLTPSDTATLDRSKVAGFATNIGGRTSHSAIMARSMEIPAVVGLQSATNTVKDGDMIILDGAQGMILVNPDADTLSTYEQKKAKFEKRQEEMKLYKDKPSITADGHEVELVANIGNPQDALGARNNGAEGVGLFRTEFLYMGRDSFPTEEEQYHSYSTVVETLGTDKPVVIRTLDIGGDKELPYLELPKEMNPFLGYRAIRICLDRKDLFKTQLRAILRASAHGNIKLMYPMISTLAELRAANEILKETQEELDAEGIAYNKKMEVGMMIEVPAAAIIADQLAKEVDFFSIGTNDLVQYTMAADRMNEKVSHLTQPFNPAVLRLIRMVIDAAHKEGKWAGMCGEMAGNLTAIPVLLGLGLDEFSMSASSVLPARVLINRLNRDELKQLAEEALMMEHEEDIQRLVYDRVPAVQELML